jgi:hypothetical protein
MGDIIPQSIPRSSRAWAVPGSTNIIPAKFPSASPKAPTDPLEIATNVVNAFNKALQSKDYPALSQLFTNDGFWRDHLALTWSFRTVQGPDNILSFLKTCAGSKDGFRLSRIVSGFSQGHVMAMLTGLVSKYAGQLGGLVGLSGYMLPNVCLVDLSTTLRYFTILW